MVWLTGERRLAIFSAGTIAREPLPIHLKLLIFEGGSSDLYTGQLCNITKVTQSLLLVIINNYVGLSNL